MRAPELLAMECVALYCEANAAEKEQVMNDINENGPLRHFRVGRRAVLQSLATGVGAVVFASRASAASAHAHHAAATAARPELATSTLQFLDQHTFDTLALLGEQ